MKLNQATITNIESNQLNNKSHTFEIGDQGIVIDILRNRLYSNPIQTLVQEYISNARDANREVNSTRPIDVTLPDDKDLTLKIRDYGPGLSPQRVADIFTKYGNSTKRNSNTQTGGFGIGAKSAWAYTDVFTIVSYYNGKAFHYIAHITKDKAGSLDLINEKDTSELNGVEIQIPIQEKDLVSFINAAKRATKYWDDSEFPVFTNDSNMVREATIDRLGDFESVALEQTNNSDYYSSRHEREIRLVIDGIPYPMPVEFEESKVIQNLRAKINCIGLLHFKIGVVEVSASREAVTNSPENQRLVEALCNKALKDINSMLPYKVSGCHSLRESLDIHKELAQYYAHDYKSAYFLTYQNDNFQLEADGAIRSNLLTGLTIEKFELGRRGYRSDSQRLSSSTVSFDTVDFRKGQWFYTDDETSHAHQFRRVKPIAVNNSVYILKGDINSPELKRLANHLNIKGTSSLGASSTRKSTKRVHTDDVLINVYPRPGSRATTSKIVNLGRNRTQYVYVIKDGDIDANNEYKQLNNILFYCDVSFCLVSESTSKKIAGNSMFIKFKEFLRDPLAMIHSNKDMFLNTMKGYVLGEKSRYSGYPIPIDVLSGLGKANLSDSELKLSAGTLATYNSSTRLKESDGSTLGLSTCEVTEKLIKAIPELSEFKKQKEVMDNMLNKYVLLNAIQESEFNKKSVVPALVTYFNAAFDGGAK